MSWAKCKGCSYEFTLEKVSDDGERKEILKKELKQTNYNMKKLPWGNYTACVSFTNVCGKSFPCCRDIEIKRIFIPGKPLAPEPMDPIAPPPTPAPWRINTSLSNVRH